MVPAPSGGWGGAPGSHGQAPQAESHQLQGLGRESGVQGAWAGKASDGPWRSSERLVQGMDGWMAPAGQGGSAFACCFLHCDL